MKTSKKTKADAAHQDEVNKEIKCCTCDRVLTGKRHIRCTRCPDFIQCLTCLSNGRTSRSHDISHMFYSVYKKSKPLFREDWDKEEEILLLFGIKMLGFGNWHEIEKIIATKSALQCQDHYINTYIKSPKAPFPVRKVLPRVDPEPIPLSYQIRDTESKPSIGHKDNLKKRNKTRPTTTGEYSDYMPYRHEFDKEYQNSAESIVGSLKFCSDETESSFQSKVERLQSYNFILQERRFRTKIIEDWRIQDIEVKTDSKMKHTIVGKDIELVRLLDPATSELREINSKILPLAPYIGHRKTLQLVQAVDKNIQNDFHIKTLRTWQSYHITSLHEGHMFKALSNYVNEKITDIDKWNDLIRKYGNTKSQTVETQFLSPEEKILCASIRVNQDMYLAIKEFMIREYSVDGHFDREKLKMITNKDLTLKQLEEIYDYMVGNGWIAE